MVIVHNYVSLTAGNWVGNRKYMADIWLMMVNYDWHLYITLKMDNDDDGIDGLYTYTYG